MKRIVICQNAGAIELDYDSQIDDVILYDEAIQGIISQEMRSKLSSLIVNNGALSVSTEKELERAEKEQEKVNKKQAFESAIEYLTDLDMANVKTVADMKIVVENILKVLIK